MARMVAIANQKGGVGKTTTAVNLAAALALNEKSVLLVDLDPQGNAGSGLGLPNLKNTNRGIYEVLTGGLPAEQAVVATGIAGLSLIPSGQRLAGAEVELVDAERREYRLKDALAPLVERFEFIFIDAPPSLGILTVNALTAAGSVLVPVQCEYYALEGLSHLLAAMGGAAGGYHALPPEKGLCKSGAGAAPVRPEDHPRVGALVARGGGLPAGGGRPQRRSVQVCRGWEPVLGGERAGVENV